MEATASRPAGIHARLLNGFARSAPPPGPPRVAPSAPARSRARLPRLAATALLLLALAGADLALGPLRPASDPGRPAAAAIAPATPALPPGVLADETVLALTLPGEELPHGTDLLTGIAHYSIPPGTRSAWTDDCCTGPMVEYVVDGAYTVRFQTPIRVYRADGPTEEIPASAEVTLGAGDALLSRQEAPFEAANDGAGPVELLDWGLVDNGNAAGPHELAGWQMHHGDLHVPPTLAPNPVRLRLRRLTLAADGTMRPTGSLVALVVSTEPHATLGRRPDGSLRNTGADPITVYVLTLDQSAAGQEASPVAASQASKERVA